MRIKIKQHDFESPYDDAGVTQRFSRAMREGLEDNEFARSLYEGASRYGGYTERQMPWLHVLVAQHEGRETKRSTRITGLAPIHEHLANCRKSREQGGKGLLHPMVGLEHDGQRVVLKLAGPKSRNYGKVGVSSDHRFGCGEFYGWIDDQGVLNSQGDVPEKVRQILLRVASDPARVISEIGRESGRCCYCFAELTTVQSKIAGCGRRCAENFSVPYPTAAVVRRHIQDHPEVLEGASDRERWEPANAASYGS